MSKTKSKRYFIELQYNGKNYHGWQVQPNAPTVQGELNEKLSTLLKEEVNLIGAGRTDTGVHARFFVAHFDTTVLKENKTEWLIHKLNSFLPGDIAIRRIYRVKDVAHARFSAVSRSYEYYISLSKEIFQHEYMWQLYYDLDVDAMNMAAHRLKDYSDFTSFSKLHTNAKTNNCKIFNAEWEKENEQLIFKITADRFLRNMVRSIVGTLVLVGRGKITLPDFYHIVELKDRTQAGESAPGHGLFLTNIDYPPSVNINDV